MQAHGRRPRTADTVTRGGGGGEKNTRTARSTTPSRGWTSSPDFRVAFRVACTPRSHSAASRGPPSPECLITELSPIPEASECLFKEPDVRSAGTTAADSDLSDATTHRDDRAERATDGRELPALPSTGEWPAHWTASGRITVRGSADPQAKGKRAVCRIREGVLTLGIEGRGAAGETTEEVAAEVPIKVLAVCLQEGRTDMFTLATVHKNRMFDEIYCFCDDPARRTRWIAVFRRMGVAILADSSTQAAASSVL